MENQVNILIAEDEPNIALALKSIVGKAVGGAAITIVGDGQEAAEKLKEKKFNLLICDWNMPRMTGLELLATVRADFQTERLPFLMLTARADAASVKAALGSGVTDYIAKPFDKEKLVEKVKKFLNGSLQNSAGAEKRQRLMDAVVASLRKGEITFPVLPELAFKAVEVINNKDVPIQEVADLIKVEAGLTSKIIALANSAQYRASRPIQELQYAIGRIGLRESANLILMHATRGLFNAEEPIFEKRQRILWEHSLATATAARLIGKLVRHPYPERLYAAGMLHDLGKVLLIQVLIALTKARDDITDEAVDQALVALHTGFGLALLKRWNFPENFIEVVQEHHNYEQMHKCSLDTQIVSYANLLSRQIGMSQHAADKESEALAAIGKLLNISSEQGHAIGQEVLTRVEEMKSMM